MRRDVVFEEEKGWNWSGDNLTGSQSSGTFVLVDVHENAHLENSETELGFNTPVH